jgi:hypothetical protein
LEPVSDSAITAAITNDNQAAIASTGRRVLQRPMAVGEKRLIMERSLNRSASSEQPGNRSLAG